LAFTNKYPVWFSGIFTILVILGYALFEYSLNNTPFSHEGIHSSIRQSLDEGYDFFNDYTNSLVQSAEHIAELTEQTLATGSGRLTLFGQIKDLDLWGITIYKNGNKWFWNGYVIAMPVSAGQLSGISLRNLNNVQILVHQQILQFNDDTYTIYAARRVSQTTDLPFVREGDFNLNSIHRDRGYFQIYYNFFGTIPSDAQYRTLHSPAGDSIGTVWATYSDIQPYVSVIKEKQQSWRLSFQLFIALVFFFFLIVLSNQTEHIYFSVIQLLFIIILWPVLLNSGLVEYWLAMIPPDALNREYEVLSEFALYVVNTLFLFLVLVSVHHLLTVTQKPLKNENHFRTIGLSVLFGILSMMLIHFFLYATESLLLNSSISLMDLELAPEVESFLFYIFSGLFFTASSGIVLTTGYHLFLSEEDKSRIIALVSFISFLTTYYIVEFVVGSHLILYWTLALKTTLFLLIITIAYFFHKYPEVYTGMSGFRKLMISVLITSLTIYSIIWNTNNDRIDRDLLAEVAEFTREQEINTRDILFELLSDTEQDFLQFSNLIPSDQIFRIQTQFQRTVQNNIRQNWGNYAYHIRLLTYNGDELSSYSTTLDTPIWSSYFNTSVMMGAYTGEQIRWQTNRPVIWGQRPANLSERYTSFDRGWIPIYNLYDDTEIILWVAGDVYRERADYNKPLRAVLTADTPGTWRKSYYLAEFRNQRIVRSTIKGIYRNQPQYNRLPEREFEITVPDSVIFFTNITADGNFREVLLNHGSTIVKASTPVPEVNHHLFSFFRLQIVLIFFGLFCFSLLAISGFNQYTLFGQNRKFRDRLIDGLTLATLLFLTVLIFSTQYAVNIQNEKNVQRDLIHNLNSISESLKERNIFSATADASEILTGITATVSADLILYRETTVQQSTTPQIFSQYLLPAELSFPAYDYLFQRERTHYLTTARIGNEEMVIGYRSVSDAEGNITGVLAIPTFTHSPVYSEQLLETTSYLFVVYLFIFALFIGGSVFLSNQLTKPLKIIQSGLNQISHGDMKTKVVVTSRDEIGSLANAYNNMVQRLDYAQKELMKAERESAWKEMAQQVAHEIKNPLTPMKLNLQHLQMRLENEPGKVSELKEIIEKTTSNIIDQIESLNKIASDFSKFAKPIQEPRKNGDLATIIRSVAELYEHDSVANIKLKLPKNELIAPIVEAELRRALINLVKNALEAAHNGNVKIQIKLKKQYEDALIQIKDNGEGIQDEDHAKIFLPKFSTKSSGTGLGLAITKKIIEAHDGEIWFESAKGQGTTFFIRLPLS
jgi:signal transduction histidine kinase